MWESSMLMLGERAQMRVYVCIWLRKRNRKTEEERKKKGHHPVGFPPLHNKSCSDSMFLDQLHTV